MRHYESAAASAATAIPPASPAAIHPIVITSVVGVLGRRCCPVVYHYLAASYAAIAMNAATVPATAHSVSSIFHLRC